MATDFLGYKLDFSCVMMVVVFKTVSCMYSVYDGTKKPEDLNGAHVRTSLKEIPNLIEYLGYIFFYAPGMSYYLLRALHFFLQSCPVPFMK